MYYMPPICFRYEVLKHIFNGGRMEIAEFNLFLQQKWKSL